MQLTKKPWCLWLVVSVLLHLFLITFLAWAVARPHDAPPPAALTLHWNSPPPPAFPSSLYPSVIETWHPPVEVPLTPSPAAPAAATGKPSTTSLTTTQPPPLPHAWVEALAFQGRPPSFFGKGFEGGRIIFVIDISGSMLQKSGTTTRLAEAHRGLMRALAGLQPYQEFNILFFADRTHTFLPAPTRAKPDAVLRAFAYIDSGVDCGGSTNLQDALRTAMAMAPDTILLLSDGEANTEDSAILTEMRHLRRRHNPRLTLHAVGFYLEAGGRADRFLRRLASELGGTYASWNPRSENAPHP